MNNRHTPTLLNFIKYNVDAFHKTISRKYLKGKCSYKAKSPNENTQQLMIGILKTIRMNNDALSSSHSNSNPNTAKSHWYRVLVLSLLTILEDTCNNGLQQCSPKHKLPFQTCVCMPVWFNLRKKETIVSYLGQRANNSLDRTSSISLLEACLFRQPTYNLQSCVPKPPAMRKMVTSATNRRDSTRIRFQGWWCRKGLGP